MNPFRRDILFTTKVPGKSWTALSMETYFFELNVLCFLVISNEISDLGGPHSTMDGILALQPSAPGLILRVPKFFSENL